MSALRYSARKTPVKQSRRCSTDWRTHRITGASWISSITPQSRTETSRQSATESGHLIAAASSDSPSLTLWSTSIQEAKNTTAKKSSEESPDAILSSSSQMYSLPRELTAASGMLMALHCHSQSGTNMLRSFQASGVLSPQVMQPGASRKDSSS